jgi:hypothetical protein
MDSKTGLSFLGTLCFLSMLPACSRSDNDIGTVLPDDGGATGGSSRTGGVLATGGNLGTGGSPVPGSGGSLVPVPGTGGSLGSGGVLGSGGKSADASVGLDSATVQGCDPVAGMKALADQGLEITGSSQTITVTLPAALTDADWGLKALNCQQGGYDIKPLAGRTVCLLGQGIVQRCSNAGDTAWVVMSDGTAKCIYETSKTLTPGVFPVRSNSKCPPADGGPDLASAPGCDLKVAAQAVAALGIAAVGDPRTLTTTLPASISNDAQWGVKASVCQQGGYDISSLAGQTVCLVGQGFTPACAGSPDTEWVVMSNGAVKCVYGSSQTASAPGVFPAGGNFCR